MLEEKIMLEKNNIVREKIIMLEKKIGGRNTFFP